MIDRVLVVDDEKEFVDSVIRHLKREGFQPESATNGIRACRKMKALEAQNAYYDLLITDVVMPEMDGITLMEWAHKFYPKTSVIVVTEFCDICPLKQKIRPLLDEICKKPMTPDSMMALIDRIQQKRSQWWQLWTRTAV